VTYDLIRPLKDYPKLHETIKSLGNWAKPLESVWLVQGNKGTKQIFDQVAGSLDENDRLLVVALEGSWWSKALSPDVADWIRANIA